MVAASGHGHECIGLSDCTCLVQASLIPIPPNAFAPDSRQEPYDVVRQVRICAGGGWKQPSLPRCIIVASTDRLPESALSRAFDAKGRPGRISEATFTIDPSILPIEEDHWQVWDISGDGVSAQPGRWDVKNGTVLQLSSIFQGSATEVNPEIERYGTLRIYQDAMEFSDGRLELEMRSDDDDSFGVVFRCRDEQHHYLFSSDRQRNFSVLAVKNGDEYRVLATTDRAYQPGKWHRLGVEMNGQNLRIVLNGDELLKATDPAFQSGSIGLHSWGSEKVQYQNIRLQTLSSN